MFKISGDGGSATCVGTGYYIHLIPVCVALRYPVAPHVSRRSRLGAQLAASGPISPLRFHLGLHLASKPLDMCCVRDGDLDQGGCPAQTSPCLDDAGIVRPRNGAWNAAGQSHDVSFSAGSDRRFYSRLGRLSRYSSPPTSLSSATSQLPNGHFILLPHGLTHAKCIPCKSPRRTPHRSLAPSYLRRCAVPRAHETYSSRPRSHYHMACTPRPSRTRTRMPNRPTQQRISNSQRAFGIVSRATRRSAIWVLMLGSTGTWSCVGYSHMCALMCVGGMRRVLIIQMTVYMDERGLSLPTDPLCVRLFQTRRLASWTAPAYSVV